MTAAEMLQALRKRDVIIKAQDKALIVDAPVGVLTANLRAWLKLLKTEILELLKQESDSEVCSNSGGSTSPEWKPNRAPSQEQSPYTRPCWDDDVIALIAWFESAGLPERPFRLRSGHQIVNPAKWYESLRGDIASGPTSPRARTQVLQQDLRDLYKIVMDDSRDRTEAA